MSRQIIIQMTLHYNSRDVTLTASSCLQKMYEGGSGLSVMMHVKFMVDPSFRWMSGPPMIAVRGSVKKINIHF